MSDRVQQIDNARTSCLCDVGAAGWIAATTIGADGQERLAVIRAEMIGRELYDAACTTAVHEQLGALPLEYLRRLTVSARTHRCGRRTCKGRPCRIRVDRPGSACEFHRLAADERTKR